MAVQAQFPKASARAGMYESFYLRAVSPSEPVGAWIRYTVHKRPGAAPRGSLWCTIFDAARGRPWQGKMTSEDVRVPADGWIAIEDALFGEGVAEGSIAAAKWSLRWSALEPELRHLRSAWLYRAPLPRTKLTSPAPLASFTGTIVVPDADGPRTLSLDGWRGMVGHNWGAEHAERWIWLHGVDFVEAPGAWLDVALGRLLIGGRLTPWVANGALSLEGRRIALGGLGARGLLVAESPMRCRLSLPATGVPSAGPGAFFATAKTGADVFVETPMETQAGWSYADPEGGTHDVSNCSIAALSVTLREPGMAAARTLHSEHGGVYELGMREHDHGVPIAPFADG